MSIKLKGNNESTFAQNIKTAKQVEVTDGIKFGDGTVQITAATGGGGGDSSGSGADAWGVIATDGTLSSGFNVTTAKGGSGGDKGIYEVTFITPMPSDNYAVTTTARAGSAANEPRLTSYQNKTTTGFTIYRYDSDNGEGSNGACSFAVFASNTIAPQAGVGADAWGNIQADGTLNAGFNVSSVTRNGPGDYSIRLAEKIPTAYAVTVGGDALSIKVPSTADNQINIQTFNSSGAQNDYKFTFAAFGSSTVTPAFTWTRQGTTLLPANAGDDVVTDGSISTQNGLTVKDFDLNDGTVYGSELSGGTIKVQKPGANESPAIQVYQGKISVIDLSTNGSITASGDVTTTGNVIGNVGSFTGNVTSNRDSSDKYCFDGQLNGNTNFYVQADGDIVSDGSITAAGPVQAGALSTTSSTSTGSNLYSSGEIYGQVAAGVNDDVDIVRLYRGTDIKTQFKADGSITAAGNIQSGGDPNNGAATGAIAESGGLFAAARAPGLAVFAGHLVGTGSATTTITSNGDAIFEGTVTANGTVLTRSSGNMNVGDELENAKNALTAIKAAATDSNTDLAGLKAAIVAALANH